MTNDMTWRKYPRDLLVNEDMRYIESRLAPELATAPYMMYNAILHLVDDDGIFDLEDGVIVHRLMRVGSIHDVIVIANLMQQRHLITRVSKDSNKCLLNDWNYPKTVKSRTAAERRQRVLELIEIEKKQKAQQKSFTINDMDEQQEAEIIDFTDGDAPEADAAITVNFANKPSSDVFLCPDVDKKAENVGRQEREIRQDKITEDNIRQDKKETHTEATGFHGYQQEPLQPVADKTNVVEKKTEETETESENEYQRIPSDQTESEVESDYNPEEVGEEIDSASREQVESIYHDFFAKNCYGYKPKQARKAVETLTERTMELANEVNPPDIIANVLCRQFKKMCETPGQHWSGMPLLPAYMIKDGVWSHLLQMAGTILLNNTESKAKWMEQVEQYMNDFEKENQTVCDLFAHEYLKYGIDPQDPMRVLKLKQAKEKEKLAKD